MTTEGHAAAMSRPIRPIRCTGHGDCRQGRAPCRTPLTCSGMPVDQAIEQLRGNLHRQPIDLPISMAAAEDIGKPWPIAILIVAVAAALIFTLGFATGRM